MTARLTHRPFRAAFMDAIIAALNAGGKKVARAFDRVGAAAVKAAEVFAGFAEAFKPPQEPYYVRLTVVPR